MRRIFESDLFYSFRRSKLTMVATAVTLLFFLLIGIEWLVGRRRGRDTYRLNDALNSIGLGVMSQLTGVFSALLTLGLLGYWLPTISTIWAWMGPQDRER